MGVGKTTNCEIIKNKLDNSFFLDGDCCWDMHEQNIINNIVPQLSIEDCKVHLISLVCSEQVLRAR